MFDLQEGRILAVLVWLMVLSGLSGSATWILWRGIQCFVRIRRQSRIMRNAMWIVAGCWFCPLIFGFWYWKEGGMLISVRIFQVTPRIKEIIVIVIGIWMAGIVWKMIQWGLRLVKTRRLKRKSEVCSDKTQRIFQDVYTELGLKKTVSLRKNKQMPPLATGGRVPYVLITEEDVLEEDLRVIFVHELIHVRHKDDILRIVLVVISCLNWYNPFIYQFLWDMDVWNEYYCDIEVIETCKISAKEYFAIVNRSISRTQKNVKTGYQHIYKGGKVLNMREEQVRIGLEKKAWGMGRGFVLFAMTVICAMALSLGVSNVMVHAYDRWYLKTEVKRELEVELPEVVVHTELPGEAPEGLTVIMGNFSKIGSRAGWGVDVQIGPMQEYRYGPIAKDAGGEIGISVHASAPIQFGIMTESGYFTYVEGSGLTYTFPIERNGFYYAVFRNTSSETVTVNCMVTY